MSLFPNRRPLATIALGSLVVLTSFACDKLESDQLQGERLVKASAEAGIKARRGLPTTQSLTAALSELQKAAGVSQASTTSKIRARSLEAQTEVVRGNRVA